MNAAPLPRAWRAPYLGSAPTLHTAHRGIEDRNIRLGCAQPGESVATFGDALRRLTDQATHLYVDGRRYWYSTQPSVARLAQDRAAQQGPDKVAEEITRRLREQARTRGDFAGVHSCPVSAGEVPDDPEARLVILGPEYPHVGKASDTPARKQAAAILDQRGTGSSPRESRNMLVFLAADRTRLSDLDQAVRQYLAWKSIASDAVALNLDAFQSNQARTKSEQADDTVTQRIPETYVWLLVPGQGKRDPNAPIDWQEIRLQGQSALAVRVSKKLGSEELLITEFAGTRLRLELDRIPLWRGEEVSVKQLAEDFAKYLYLPRFKDSEVLVDSIRDGLKLVTWQQDSFAYADGWDAEKKRYRGLRAGQLANVAIDGQSVLVKPDVATAQFAAEAQAAALAPATAGVPGVPADTPAGAKRPAGGAAGPGPAVEPPPAASQPHRFHGSVGLDPARLGRDAGKIAEEVLQHLSLLPGAKVEVTLEISAEAPGGVPDNVVRTVTANCRTLRFRAHGFEEK